jgi:adenosine kinase
MTRIMVTGSVATDHLMRFPGRFAEQLIADKLDSVSLSFLVDDLVIRGGGAAANIAYGLAQLGARPILVGAVGSDFAAHRAELERLGVRCELLVSSTAATARFICTTDTDGCQIASFYPGAMIEASRIDLADLLGEVDGEPALVLIAPDAPAAMQRHAQACRATGSRFAADPSQQLAHLSAEQALAFITGAELLLTNEYEHDLLLRKTGRSSASLLELVGAVVTTRGARGVRIRTRAGVSDVPAVPIGQVADPTGGGDAFRAGLLAAYAAGLDLLDAAAIGCHCAWYALRSSGGQGYRIDPASFDRRLARTHGEDLAARFRAALGAPAGR